MKRQTLKNTCAEFFKFLVQKNNLFLFTALFYALWIIQTLITSEKFELHSLQGRMLGIATFQGYDVGARVALFYKCVLLLLLFFLLFNFIGFLIAKNVSALLPSPELPLLNCASLAGIFLFLFHVFEIKVFETLEFVYFIHKFVIAAIVLRMLFFKKNKFSVFYYVLILSLALSLYFFVADVVNFLGYYRNPDFYAVLFILSLLLLLWLHVYLNKRPENYQANNLRVVFRTLSPLMFLPIISILKDEMFLVLKANGIFLSSPFPVWLCLIFILVVAIYIRHRRAKNKLPDAEREQLARVYFPRLLFSLIAYTYYNSTMEFYMEMFESGNRYLPLMEYKLFGVIPTLEKFNSHLLSDYFFSALYSILNNMNIIEIEFYDFLLVPISFLLYYYLMYFLTRNAFFSLFSILFFPLAIVLFPNGYCFGILALMVLHRIVATEASLKNYLLFFASITFFIFWRSDLGYSCVIVMPLILLFYHVVDNKFKLNWKYLAQSFFIVVGTVILIFSMLSFYRNVNIFYKLLYALNYLASAQTYGYNAVSIGQTLEYRMHYFIFPVVVSFIILTLLFRFKSLNGNSLQRFSYLSLLFLCTYYFANFNRGLVRHSLVEGVDTFTSSYVYIILPSAFLVFFKTKFRLATYVLFFALTFFMILNYAVPHNNEHKSEFEKMLGKINARKNDNLAVLKSRVKNLPKQNIDQAFIDFAKQHLHGSETFIDFVNRPMLYFYTQKITPSYFYQNPLCSHNDFLQNRFIADLTEYDTPYLIYSTLSGNGFMVDDVPNSFRHYRMAEYFYTHYKPYVILGDYCLWRRNDVADQNKKDTVFSYKKNPATVRDTIQTQILMKANKCYLVKTTFADKLELPTLTAYNKLYTFSAQHVRMSDTVVYTILAGVKKTLYNIKWHQKNIEAISVVECDYIPDFYSDKYFNYDLQKLPAVWGRYDKQVSSETVLFDGKEQLAKTDKDIPVINIPETLDKISGNTVVLKIKNKTPKEKKLFAYLANDKSKLFTLVSFDVISSDKEETYAIRISSIYKWYSGNINKISFWWDFGHEALEIKDIKITKGS